MTDTPKVPRRACDFCYRRKIKCDGLKPRCSHCVSYMKDCAYVAPSRKSQPRKRTCQQVERDGNVDDASIRFDRLEAQVKELTARLEASRKIRGSEKEHLADNDVAGSIAAAAAPLASDGRERLTLPPLQYVLQLVHDFLENFNTILPLFHGPSLLHMVHEFYDQNSHRHSPVVWAAINIVLGLAHRFTLTGDSDSSHAIKYLNRAQSVLSSVILADTELLTIQVLLGMVMLLQGSNDHDPPLLLIGTTMRLAHKIGLHDRSHSMPLDHVIAQQRACVFWIAYILDKDIGFRIRQPSIQIDDDVDLDLPFSNTAIDSSNASGSPPGVLATMDGEVKWNYFVSRIQLAILQGGVYDYLYSTRAAKRTPEERSHALESVAVAVEQWKASIPPEFTAHIALQRVSSNTLRHLVGLHSMSLACTTSINQANAWNPQWVEELREHEVGSPAPVLPRQWETAVDDARGLLSIFRALPIIDRSNFWMNGCSQITSMMLLTANMTYNPNAISAFTDGELVESGLFALDEMIQGEPGTEHLQKFRDLCAEMSSKAQLRTGSANKVRYHDLRLSEVMALR